MILAENTVVAERFKLSRMIGQGGMGSVWEATDLRLSTICAVKFIEGEMAHMTEAHSRFQREARAAAQLRSPHVVQIFDHGVWEGHPYIAMELLVGEDLGKRIGTHARATGGRLPIAFVNTVIEQVCRALTKAHAAGVVHRDLKPDNIYIVTDDDREIVKILDFGVAKSASQALDGSNTKTGAMLGTPYYMSPEQAQGIKSVDSRSDLWSLAVIVFQCLTGRLPFESEALGDLLVKIIVNPIPTPSSFNNALPPAFDQWWTKAADRNPDNRFQTAKAFAESLSLALGQSSPSLGEAQDRSQPAFRSATVAMTTPNPMHGPPQQFPTGPGHAATPAPYRGPMASQPFAAMSTGNPVAGTFSGVEPAAGLPKKGVPVAVFLGIGAIVLVGLGLGGAALVAKGRTAQGSTTASSASSPVAVLTVESPTAPVAAPASAPASSTVAATVTTVSTAVVAPVAAVAGAHRPVAAPTHSVATRPSTPTTGATAASGTAKKPAPINLGF